MFQVTPDTEFLPEFGYQQARTFGKLMFAVTRGRRAHHVGAFVPDAVGKRLLDVGCGDGYFLKKYKAVDRYGMDLMIEGEAGNFSNGVACEDGFFDYLTMLAVIEHLPDPEFVFGEAYRILKPGGLFAFTTPKQKAEGLINLYAKHVEDDHEVYFTQESVGAYAGDQFAYLTYRPFLFGLNQLFVLRRN